MYGKFILKVGDMREKFYWWGILILFLRLKII